ncbi:MAG: hypothetical protein AVDCRST_MAG76-3765, partial [uncultured Acidimicrobiales bacterium]
VPPAGEQGAFDAQEPQDDHDDRAADPAPRVPPQPHQGRAPPRRRRVPQRHLQAV